MRQIALQKAMFYQAKGRVSERETRPFAFMPVMYCLVLAKVDTFMNNKKCVKQCERVQQSTAMSSN